MTQSVWGCINKKIMKLVSIKTAHELLTGIKGKDCPYFFSLSSRVYLDVYLPKDPAHEKVECVLTVKSTNQEKSHYAWGFNVQGKNSPLSWIEHNDFDKVKADEVEKLLQDVEFEKILQDHFSHLEKSVQELSS